MTDLANDPAFVERTAREIGMVKTNETVFRISRDQARANAANSH